MNQKQLLILVVVLAVLGAAGVMILKKDAASRQSGGTKGAGAQLLESLPVGEELAGVLIRNHTNTLTLAKQDGVWVVKERGDYPADYSEISRAVLKLRDLKATQTETVGESQLARLELLEPDAAEGGGTLIEFRDKAGQPLASLLLGKEQTRKESRPPQFGGGGEEMDMPVGRWVMLPADKTHAALVSDTLSTIKANPADWLNKDFFKVQKIESIEVTRPEAATNSFKLSRETESGTWTLAGLGEKEELDTTKTSSFNYALGSPNFEDVIVNPDDAALGLDTPTTIAIQTFEGFHYHITAGDKTNSSIPMRVTVTADYPRERTPAEGEDETVKATKDKEFADTLKTRDEKLAKEKALGSWTYRVSSWTLDSILKNRSDLVKAKEEPKPEEAKTEEVSGGEVDRSTLGPVKAGSNE